MTKTMNQNSSVILIKMVCWRCKIGRGWRLSKWGRTTITTIAVVTV